MKARSESLSSNEPNEASRLLSYYMPSPQSTDRSVAGLIESIPYDNDNDDDDMSSRLSRVPSDTHLELESLSPSTSTLWRMDRWNKRAAMVVLMLPLGLVILATTLPAKNLPPAIIHNVTTTTTRKQEPFSTLDPVQDLGLYAFDRPYETSPQVSVLKGSNGPLPTNAWYENLLLYNGEPTATQRAYTVPYVVDMVGPIPGIRMHPTHIETSQTVMQLDFVASHGLTLGMGPKKLIGSKPDLSRRYSVIKTTPTGLTLAWNVDSSVSTMTSSIVQGMPFATMHYPKDLFLNTETTMYPTIGSEISMHQKPIVDGDLELDCGGDKMLVQKELQLTFYDSDFTWLVFFSEPVYLTCIQEASATATLPVGVPPPSGDAVVALQVVDYLEKTTFPLTVRMTPLANCTSGHNPIYCRRGPNQEARKKYVQVLRRHSNLYPGPDTNVEYSVNGDAADLIFDWDVRDMTGGTVSVREKKNGALEPFQRRRLGNQEPENSNNELITFALPHHMEQLKEATPLGSEFCKSSLRGSSCLVRGSSWTLSQNLPPISFRAPRSPSPNSMQAIANALQHDIFYTLPSYYQHGVGDTYFSGKMLAKLGRILIVADEMLELCPPPAHRHRFHFAASRSPCDNVTLPSEADFDQALHRLRSGVEIWINGTGAVPFVYDSAWGGLVSCGCDFDSGSESCRNSFPNCPAFSNPGLNFGNGFYNDHHFHLGYHIYAAAVVSHFDPDWGEQFFEKILLLIRDIANPSVHDGYFPAFRHKDWYSGNSWASGISSASYLNGKNQESSSEAISSYEAVALYGSVMRSIWRQKQPKKMEVASHVYDVGRLLTATEVDAANWYWHVRHEDPAMNVYPREYRENVVGVMWSTMAQFQTWFGNAPYLPYGIQLLPLTAVSEQRDSDEWVREAYSPFAEGCNDHDACTTDGWSVLQYALLASVGHKDLAMKKARALPSAVFESAGGNGHSLSNTLWYISTRPDSTNPLPIPESEISGKAATDNSNTEKSRKPKDCGCPKTCTSDVLDREAQLYTCRERITWVMEAWGYTEDMACGIVGGMDYPEICGPCNPNGCGEKDDHGRTGCPPCTEETCRDPTLSRCPQYDHTYVCTHGPSRGGCSPKPWYDVGQCHECCETSSCKTETKTKKNAATNRPVKPQIKPQDEKNCPPCSDTICEERMAKLCPADTAPFLCSEGASSGGCSPEPWEISYEVCDACCTLSHCQEHKKKDSSKDCPPCSKEVCKLRMAHTCPVEQSPFLCTQGDDAGGCSEEPWDVVFGACEECCNVSGCHDERDEKNCLPCSKDVCRGNHCSAILSPFLCTAGDDSGGCSEQPWDVTFGTCEECCNVAECQDEGDEKDCPPCSQEICMGEVNRCSASLTPFLCTEGANSGGCSDKPWDVDFGACEECCTVTACHVADKQDEKKCPPCSHEVCRGELNQCPIEQAPFLCTEGAGRGGCSSRPWHVGLGICDECCVITPGCERGPSETSTTMNYP